MFLSLPWAGYCSLADVIEQLQENNSVVMAIVTSSIFIVSGGGFAASLALASRLQSNDTPSTH